MPCNKATEWQIIYSHDSQQELCRRGSRGRGGSPFEARRDPAAQALAPARVGRLWFMGAGGRILTQASWRGEGAPPESSAPYLLPVHSDLTAKPEAATATSRIHLPCKHATMLLDTICLRGPADTEAVLLQETCLHILLIAKLGS